MEKVMNYKDRDRQLIEQYVSASGGTADVSDIIEESGAEKMRVYPIIQEMVLSGQVEVTDTEELGAPRTISATAVH